MNSSFLLFQCDHAYRAMRVDMSPAKVIRHGEQSTEHAEIGDVNHLIRKGTTQVVGFHLVAVPVSAPGLLRGGLTGVRNLQIYNEDELYIYLDPQTQPEEAFADGWMLVGSYVLHDEWRNPILIIPQVVPNERIGFPLRGTQGLVIIWP